jgi:hypothetical protein
MGKYAFGLCEWPIESAALFRNKEMYENDENSHDKFKSTQINSVSNSEFLEHSVNWSPAQQMLFYSLDQGWHWTWIRETLADVYEISQSVYLYWKGKSKLCIKLISIHLCEIKMSTHFNGVTWKELEMFSFWLTTFVTACFFLFRNNMSVMKKVHRRTTLADKY